MIVFGCKYRQALIHERWESDLYKLFSFITEQHGKGCKLIKAGGIFDHVHLLLSLSQNIAPKDIVREIKARSSNWINDNHLCRGRFEWQNGCGYFSFSVSNLDNVKHYIENQKEHHRGKSFRDEMISLYKKHNFAFNEFFLPEDLV